MEQDNGWFERGELPPVGVDVEIFNGFSWVSCDVICYSKTYVIVEHEGQETPFLKAAVKFRKIKTERDKFLDRALFEWNRTNSPLIDFLGEQYDKGMRYIE